MFGGDLKPSEPVQDDNSDGLGSVDVNSDDDDDDDDDDDIFGLGDSDLDDDDDSNSLTRQKQQKLQQQKPSKYTPKKDRSPGNNKDKDNDNDGPTAVLERPSGDDTRQPNRQGDAVSPSSPEQRRQQPPQPKLANTDQIARLKRMYGGGDQ